jgi:4-hydroxyphenylpyruvate dioxygenase
MTYQNDDSVRLKRDVFVSIKGFDYIELYVGNAHQAAHFYRTAFGFLPVAYAGPETGERDRVSYLMKQGQVRLILTAAISPESQVAEHVQLHGDSIKDIAFLVDDAQQAFAIAVKRGAAPIMEPSMSEGQDGRVIKATIATYGHTVHSFIQREGVLHTLFPQYRPITKALPALSYGLEAVDHVAISVEKGTLDQWVDFYKNILDFHQSHQENVFTEYSAMNSKVVQNSNGGIKFPVVEPALVNVNHRLKSILNSIEARARNISHFCQVTL